MRISDPKGDESDPSRALLHHAPALAPAMFAYGTALYKKTRLSFREFEAARMRTAEINGCMVCRAFRAERDLDTLLGQRNGADVRSNGPAPDEALYANVLQWRTSSNYSSREKLAIEFAERMSLAPDELAYDEDLWTRAKSLLNDAEIADLCLCIGGWMAGGRIMHVLGLDTVCMSVPEDKEAS